MWIWVYKQKGASGMDQILNTFKILSDETRLRMLVLLLKDELCVCELGGILDVPQPRVSRNLAKLKDLNIVSDQRKDRFIFYSYVCREPLLTEILQSIHAHLQDYPLLAADVAKLADKERFLPQNCMTCTTKE